MILNLCVNARDAMPQGGSITLETRNVDLDAAFCADNPWAREGSFVRLSVTDTGCGMGEETITRVFEPFFTTKEVGKGTGLGLATVHGIVEQHEGLIQVTSLPGSGTTFAVYLPQATHEIADKPEPAGEVLVGGDETVLVAEDDPSVRRVIARTLGDHGYKMLMACNGSEAVELFEEHAGDVDLVLLDLVMPVMGGIAAREKILEIAPDCLVAFSTGYSAQAAQSQFSLTGKTPLIPKPYTPKGLLKQVREVLDAR